jgi:hypothetical protein
MSLSNIRVFPQTKVIIDQICNPKVLGSLTSAQEGNINADTLTALSELVNIYIRDILRSPEYGHKSNIQQAIEKVKLALSNKLSQNYDDAQKRKILAIFDSYLEIVKKLLKEKPSRNKKSFNEYLRELVREDDYFKNKNLPASERVNKDDDYVDKFDNLKELLEHILSENYFDLPEDLRLELIKVSFNGFTEGLLIYPILDDLDELLINLENLPDGFQVSETEDTYFPFEIVFEEFLFILDDDGTIFTYVENFTHDLFLRAGKLLIDLAIEIYCHANRPRTALKSRPNLG